MRCFKIFIILIFISLGLPCYASINIVVSILPQRFFVKKIADNRVNISVVVPAGYNPAVYEPTPSQMKEIEKANIYFAIGVPFEKVWIKRFISLNKKLIVVHTDKGIKKRKILFEWLDTKKQITDPHIWLSPELVKKQVKIIAAALEQIDPDGKDIYRKNLALFLSQIDRLDKKIEDILKEEKGKSFMVVHPCWGYFAERYGLKQIPIEIQGREPSGFWIAKLVNYCKQMNIKVIFVQPQFSQKISKIIAKEIGAKIEVIDPLTEDWTDNILDVAKKIKKAISAS